MKSTVCVLLSAFLILLGCAKTNDQESGPQIVAWGDSLTLGLGSTGGDTYPAILQQLSSIKILNEGVRGETSTRICDRMVHTPKLYKDPVIIWAGRNNFINPAQVKNDIDTMVSKLGHNYYLVLGVLNADRANERKGRPYNNIIKKLNTDLAVTYGDHFIDVRTYLISEYNPNDSVDLRNFNDDIPPHSLRFDDLHLNSLGYSRMARKIYEKIEVLKAGL
jgi:lysophospholipase L1-like esterase